MKSRSAHTSACCSSCSRGFAPGGTARVAGCRVLPGELAAKAVPGWDPPLHQEIQEVAASACSPPFSVPELHSKDTCRDDGVVQRYPELITEGHRGK